MALEAGLGQDYERRLDAMKREYDARLETEMARTKKLQVRLFFVFLLFPLVWDIVIIFRERVFFLEIVVAFKGR
jgi:hypothetical protein